MHQISDLAELDRAADRFQESGTSSVLYKELLAPRKHDAGEEDEESMKRRGQAGAADADQPKNGSLGEPTAGVKKLHANEVEVEATGNWRDELKSTREIERQLESYNARKGKVATTSAKEKVVPTLGEVERKESSEASRSSGKAESDADMLKEPESDDGDVAKDDDDDSSDNGSDSEDEGSEFTGPKVRKEKHGVIPEGYSAKEWSKKIKEDQRQKRIEKSDTRDAKRRHKNKKKK